MAKHIVSACPTAPADIKLKYSHYLKRKEQPPPSPVTKNGANNASEEVPPPSEQPAHHISAQEQAEFQYDLAKTVYAMGSSFRSVGHPANTWFFAKHKPGYRLPNRHQVSGPLLDKAYDEQQVEVYEGIRRHPYVSIVMDGYTDTNSEHIINYMIVAPDLRPLFGAPFAPKPNVRLALCLRPSYSRPSRPSKMFLLPRRLLVSSPIMPRT